MRLFSAKMIQLITYRILLFHLVIFLVLPRFLRLLLMAMVDLLRLRLRLMFFPLMMMHASIPLIVSLPPYYQLRYPQLILSL
ncbi:MAG: hypothetical protein ED554_12615 [Synechococcus sp. YX04-3]|nr:MAG: hypothetical protein ED554_12615 [Synechococcus sp. YX04-3]